MALTLILALILAPVAAADNCVSSASWTKRDEPRKDCAWVGRLPEKRCDVRGAAPARARWRLPQPVVHDLRQRREALEARQRRGVDPHPILRHPHPIATTD